MSRTLSAATQSEVAKTTTSPIIIVELGFSVVRRLCSRGSVSWNGQTWAESGLAYDDRGGQIGAERATLRLPNHDGVYSALVLSEGSTGQAAKVWALYGAGPYAVGDAVQLFDGETDGAPSIGPREVVLDLVGGEALLRHSPRRFLKPPLCNFMPARGELVEWGGEVYTLKGAR